MLATLKTLVPWPVKMMAKAILWRLPVARQVWKRLMLFEHGKMDQPDYAYRVFVDHYERAYPPGLKNGFVALEIGPGDTLYSALIARAFGAAQTFLVDQGNFASRDLSGYLAMAAYLERHGHTQRLTEEIGNFQAWLDNCGARYLTAGLSSLRTLPDNSVDFIWSHATLEHIRKAEFADMMGELRRVVRAAGICSHRVDLTDHLGGALNNLRFSDKLWESDFFAGSGFYTNRIRYSEMLRLFEEAGFDVQVCGIDRWPSLPNARRNLAPAFKDLPEEDLRVSGFDVILRPTPT